MVEFNDQSDYDEVLVRLGEVARVVKYWLLVLGDFGISDFNRLLVDPRERTWWTSSNSNRTQRTVSRGLGKIHTTRST